MAKAYCNDVYCGTVEETTEATITETALMMGVWAVFAMVVGGLLWYGVSMGLYTDPSTFPFID